MLLINKVLWRKCIVDKTSFRMESGCYRNYFNVQNVSSSLKSNCKKRLDFLLFFFSLYVKIIVITNVIHFL